MKGYATVGSIWRRRGITDPGHERLVVGRIGNIVVLQCACGVDEERTLSDLRDDFSRIL